MASFHLPGSICFRSVLNAVLGRLKRSVLESLVKVLERGGEDSGPCCLIPPANLRKKKKHSARRGTVFYNSVADLAPYLHLKRKYFLPVLRIRLFYRIQICA
jgi:hypothetical protein